MGRANWGKTIFGADIEVKKHSKSPGSAACSETITGAETAGTKGPQQIGLWSTTLAFGHRLLYLLASTPSFSGRHLLYSDLRFGRRCCCLGGLFQLAHQSKICYDGMGQS